MLTVLIVSSVVGGAYLVVLVLLVGSSLLIEGWGRFGRRAMELLVLVDLLAWFPGVALARSGPEYLFRFFDASHLVYLYGASACLCLATLRSLPRVLPLSGIWARKFLAATGLAALVAAGVMDTYVGGVSPGWSSLDLVSGTAALVYLVVAWRALVYGPHPVTAAASEGSGGTPG